MIGTFPRWAVLCGEILIDPYRCYGSHLAFPVANAFPASLPRVGPHWNFGSGLILRSVEPRVYWRFFLDVLSRVPRDWWLNCNVWADPRCFTANPVRGGTEIAKGQPKLGEGQRDCEGGLEG
jgi:hypothetical protein